MPLADNVRARVRALKIRTRGCRAGTKLKLKRSLSCPGVTTSSNDTCGLIPVLTGNRHTRPLSSYVMSRSMSVVRQTVFPSHVAPDVEAVAPPSQQCVVPSSAASSAAPDVVVLPSPSTERERERERNLFA